MNSVVRPALFDHVVFGTYNLQAGIDMIEEKTGVKAARGGCHPNAGTCNALFSIGYHQYFEILAPNPDVEVTPKGEMLATLRNGAIINWAARTQDIDALSLLMTKDNIETRGIIPGSRKTPDGDLLSWKVLPASIPDVKIFPFFIEWQTDKHPASTSPTGCTLKSFHLVHNDPAKVRSLFEIFGLEFPILESINQGYSLVVQTPKGEVEFK